MKRLNPQRTFQSVRYNNIFTSDFVVSKLLRTLLTLTLPLNSDVVQFYRRLGQVSVTLYFTLRGTGESS